MHPKIQQRGPANSGPWKRILKRWHLSKRAQKNMPPVGRRRIPARRHCAGSNQGLIAQERKSAAADLAEETQAGSAFSGGGGASAAAWAAARASAMTARGGVSLRWWSLHTWRQRRAPRRPWRNPSMWRAMAGHGVPWLLASRSMYCTMASSMSSRVCVKGAAP